MHAGVRQARAAMELTRIPLTALLVPVSLRHHLQLGEPAAEVIFSRTRTIRSRHCASSGKWLRILATAPTHTPSAGTPKNFADQCHTPQGSITPASSKAVMAVRLSFRLVQHRSGKTTSRPQPRTDSPVKAGERPCLALPQPVPEQGCDA